MKKLIAALGLLILVATACPPPPSQVPAFTFNRTLVLATVTPMDSLPTVRSRPFTGSVTTATSATVTLTCNTPGEIYAESVWVAVLDSAGILRDTLHRNASPIPCGTPFVLSPTLSPPSYSFESGDQIVVVGPFLTTLSMTIEGDPGVTPTQVL